MIILWDSAQKRKLEEREFLAQIHGFSMVRESDGAQAAPPAAKEARMDDGRIIPMFRNPKEYEGMSKEEKDKLTQQMMTAHRAWSGSKNSVLKGGE